ncbi:XRE family transcriptional regulator [Actinoplanes missouriensis]|uniref:XRE family transcriptional regulator n=1 Tax=Actinoplanes missouriensis TaxID=1866 RepID=UPI0033C58A19
MNHPRARALRGAGLNAVDVAAQLAVDPKTVNRWISGRMPYPRHRAALAEMTGWSSRDLWPTLPSPAEQTTHVDEVRIVYPHRSAVPAESWLRLFAQAETEISIVAYSALFLAENIAVTTVLRSKATAGVRVRLALGDPDGTHIAERGNDEDIGDGMSARIRTALVGFRPVIEAGAELRLHNTVLYNSIYRADAEMLVNTHVYGHPGGHAPVFDLCRQDTEGMTGTYLDSIERVWAASERPADCSLHGQPGRTRL